MKRAGVKTSALSVGENMANIVGDSDVQATAPLASSQPASPSIPIVGEVTPCVRPDTQFANVLSECHPHLVEALARLNSRDTGTFIDWLWWDRNMRSVRGDFLRVESGYRTYAKQDALYQQGRTTPGAIVTHAPPGQSYHNYGLAVDLVSTKWGYGSGQVRQAGETFGRILEFDKAGAWIETGLPAFMESMGLTWGGRSTSFPDPPHYQYSILVPVEGYTPAWWSTEGQRRSISGSEGLYAKSYKVWAIGAAVVGGLVYFKLRGKR